MLNGDRLSAYAIELRETPSIIKHSEQLVSAPFERVSGANGDFVYSLPPWLAKGWRAYIALATLGLVMALLMLR